MHQLYVEGKKISVPAFRLLKSLISLPNLNVTALTRLRTFNGPALVERCYRAWHNKTPIHLHYRNDMGLEQNAPILAARNVETEEGHVLLLWVYLDSEKVEYEMDSGDDEGFEDDFDE